MNFKFSLSMKYYNVYYFCQIANNTIGKFDFVTTNGHFMDTLDIDFIRENPFPKQSILYSYCVWLIDRVIYEQTNYITQGKSEIVFEPLQWICQAIKIYEKIDIPLEFWMKNDHEVKVFENDYISIFPLFLDYLNDFKNDLYYTVIEKIALEVEHILFQNRKFLLEFNETISCLFDDETLNRAKPPVWVKNAIFYRDQGCCVFCKTSLSGQYNMLEEKGVHFDHIVPLQKGGLNDVCNIQLTCKKCNQSKGIDSKTDSLYQSSY